MTNLQGFDLHIAGRYTESLACQGFNISRCNQSHTLLLKAVILYVYIQILVTIT